MNTEDCHDPECIESVDENESNNGRVKSAGSQSQHEQIQDENPWPHLNDYILLKSKLGEKLMYQCKLCLPKLSTIKAHASSLNKLKQHMKRMHASKYGQFEEKVKAGSTRGKKKNYSMPFSSLDLDSSSSGNLFSPPSTKRLRQQSIGESFGIVATGSGVSQTSVDRCIVNFFVANMIPLHVVKSVTFVKLIKMLNPSKSSISRRTLGRRIVDSHAQLKQHLIDILGKIDWLATTADCWSAHRKSYLGMTVHWIDPVTRARMHAVLACMRIKGVHGYNVLAQMMINIHYEFHIEKKVTRTTTDNGSNFVKTFVQFGTEADILPDMPSPSHDVSSDTDDAVTGLSSDSSVEQEFEYISLENVLAASDGSNTNVESLDLPVHMRCAAHTFNLVATKDADTALQISIFKTPYRAAMAKARAIWDLQSRSTVASDNIESELGRKLVIPNTTRWNSTYDAVVVLNAILETKRPALRRVMTQINLKPFNDQDVAIMKEYVKVMSPVARALDLIQGEAQAYLGTLLPTIATTVFKLQDIKPLVHCCTPLVNALLSGIEKRFERLMEDGECQLAAAFHPKFRLLWLQKYDSSKVSRVKKLMEEKIEDALNRERDANESASISGSSNNEEEGDDFFSSVTRLEERSKGHKSLRIQAHNLVRTWLDSKSKDSLSDAAFLGKAVLINLFNRYNTAIPSSAAVERLFSTGKDILRDKRSSLSDDNFNMLMFMKGNMHLMQDE